MVHIENSAMAVDPSFPVCGNKEVGECYSVTFEWVGCKQTSSLNVVNPKDKWNEAQELIRTGWYYKLMIYKLLITSGWQTILTPPSTIQFFSTALLLSTKDLAIFEGTIWVIIIHEIYLQWRHTFSHLMRYIKTALCGSVTASFKLSSLIHWNYKNITEILPFIITHSIFQYPHTHFPNRFALTLPTHKDCVSTIKRNRERGVFPLLLMLSE